MTNIIQYFNPLNFQKTIVDSTPGHILYHYTPTYIPPNSREVIADDGQILYVPKDKCFLTITKIVNVTVRPEYNYIYFNHRVYEVCFSKAFYIRTFARSLFFNLSKLGL